MQSYLAVFRSRTQALDCAARLRKAGVSASAVATPKEAKAGCGLSVKIGAFGMAQAKRVVAGGRYSSFVGFFCMETACGRDLIYPA